MATSSGAASYTTPRGTTLTLNADVQHVSRRPGNFSNTDMVDGYSTVDLGLRYQTKLREQSVALRLGVYNVFDKGYWANIAPTGQNGYNSVDNGTGTLGAPRTVRLQMQVAL